MVELAFVSSPGQNWFFHELIATLRHELDLMGIPSIHSGNGFPDPTSDRVYVITPPHEYLALEGEDALGDDPTLMGRTILICAEQPRSVHFTSNVQISRRAGGVFDINSDAVRQFQRHGIAAEHLALGYTSRWDHYAPTRVRDIDVLFMGCHTPRRARHLASYSRVLARRGCHLQLSDNSTPNSEGSPSFIADDKWQLLSRSKLIINLHQGDEPYFEWLRALDAIHCGCVLVSEHSTAYAPLEPGRHFYSGSPESLGLLADHLADDQPRLTATAQRAYELIREDRPLSRAVQRLVVVASRLARGPVPTRVPPKRDRHAAPSKRNAATSVTSDPDASVIRRALKDARLDALELRRVVAGLAAQLQSPQDKPFQRVRRVAWTSAWSGSLGERVTVVTALYNHAKEVREALDSVAQSRYRHLEIVVVDDGSTDGSGEAVQAWMRSHDHIAALLVEHTVNRGLGFARNTAVDFARGEFCFVLDADNQIYPRCLETLAARLEGDPQLAFSYPMLEVFQHVDSYAAGTGDYLLSSFAWNPSWLRSHNFIDAMAMIRTTVLRELGGYALDRRLHGLEDWDLWCRIADRGLHGAQVAQPLGRYRASPGSMLALAGISLTSAFAALTERSPTLMAGCTPPL
jgi:Glycosyl transferase family 2